MYLRVFFSRLKDYFPALQEEGFTTGQQAIMQIIALGVTLGIAVTLTRDGISSLLKSCKLLEDKDSF